MAKRIEIEFNGIKYYRYPESKQRHNRNYYYPAPKYRRKGLPTLHREIWKFHNGSIPEGMQIHHIDGNPDNNSIENLSCLSLIDHHRLHETEEERKNISEKIKIAWKSKPQYKKQCKFCGKDFLTYWENNAKHCSGNCRAKARDRSKKDHIQKKCVICNNMFISRKYNGSVTCSRFCADTKASQTKMEKKLLKVS